MTTRRAILLPEGVTKQLAEKLVAAVEAELTRARVFSFGAHAIDIEWPCTHKKPQ